jgi:hypothetical protein
MVLFTKEYFPISVLCPLQLCTGWNASNWAIGPHIQGVCSTVLRSVLSSCVGI